MYACSLGYNVTSHFVCTRTGPGPWQGDAIEICLFRGTSCTEHYAVPLLLVVMVVRVKCLKYNGQERFAIVSCSILFPVRRVLSEILCPGLIQPHSTLVLAVAALNEVDPTQPLMQLSRSAN